MNQRNPFIAYSFSDTEFFMPENEDTSAIQEVITHYLNIFSITWMIMISKIICKPRSTT